MTRLEKSCSSRHAAGEHLLFLAIFSPWFWSVLHSLCKMWISVAISKFGPRLDVAEYAGWQFSSRVPGLAGSGECWSGPECHALGAGLWGEKIRVQQQLVQRWLCWHNAMLESGHSVIPDFVAGWSGQDCEEAREATKGSLYSGRFPDNDVIFNVQCCDLL